MLLFRLTAEILMPLRHCISAITPFSLITPCHWWAGWLHAIIHCTLSPLAFDATPLLQADIIIFARFSFHIIDIIAFDCWCHYYAFDYWYLLLTLTLADISWDI
jgi:hypothetical protein